MEEAAAVVGAVFGDGAIEQRRRRALMPPPCRVPDAELPLMVQLVSVAVMAWMPPPLMAGGVAADGAVGQRRRGGVDAAAVSPAELPLTVQLVSVAVVALMPPPRCRRRSCR